MNTLENIVAEYKSGVNKTTENQPFKEQESLAAAIEFAALKKHSPHQRRIHKQALQLFVSELLKRESEISKVKNFHELMRIVNDAGREIWGIGALTVYDTAERIGLFLGIKPDRVYLHAGTITGAINLFGKEYLHKRIVEDGFLTIAKESFPQELQQCSCAVLEDILCIYKDRFNKPDSNFPQSSCNSKKKSKGICCQKTI